MEYQEQLQRKRFSRAQMMKRVARFSRGIFSHLLHHGGHQVKRLVHFRKLLEDAHHAVVVLERVQARPGQIVFAGDQVLIKGLVHVP